MSERNHASIGIHETAALKPLPAGRQAIFRRARLVTLVSLAVLAGGAVLTFGLHRAHGQALASVTLAQSRTFVAVHVVQTGADAEAVTQPGTLQGDIESPIYARTSGYVLKWSHDIGARVNKGDLLAELDTPEIDQELSQAIASENQALASLELARTSAERWQSLREKDAVSQQELDEKRSSYKQAQDSLHAAQANARRLRNLSNFKKVMAPFSGTITRRNVNVGDLVDAGSSGGNARPLFTLAKTDPLRVYVYVPQLYAHLMHTGLTVDITQAELGGQHFAGKITHTAGALDASTRTLQIEIQLPNPHGTLLPGTFVDVHIPALMGHQLIVPSNSILFRDKGTQLALVDKATDGAQAHVHVVPVVVGRDFGQTIEILSGIREGDAVVLNPADSLSDGDTVQIRQPVKEKPKS